VAPRKKLMFLAQLGAPGRYDPRVFANQPGGDDEVHWFELLLADLGLLDAVDYEGRWIARGEPPPDLDEADAFVIGGSFHSVHDGLGWQAALNDWVRAQWSRETPRPVFGICGGHQTICHVHGETVGRHPDGVRVGTFPVSLTEAGRAGPLFDGVVPRFHFGNEDRVAAPPPGATVLATGDGMPACALDHGKGWMSVQFHPEATASAMAESWGPKMALEYKDSYAPTPDSPRLILNFLKANGIV
jgi:GMP synthase-like glutamine amidotransferase